MRRYVLRKYFRGLFRVRAFGTRCYVCADGMDTAPAKPREFTEVAKARAEFFRVAPKGWEPVIEEVPLLLGMFGTGVIAGSDVERIQETPS